MSCVYGEELNVSCVAHRYAECKVKYGLLTIITPNKMTVIFVIRVKKSLSEV